MCIIFINSSPIHEIKLIIAFNRDEVKTRPTLPAHLWSDQHCYGGKDASPGGAVDGTWLGVSKSGKVSALLNVHNKGKGILFSPDRSPRGGLVPGFLKHEDSAEKYVEAIKEGNFNYFNLFMGEFKSSTPCLYVYDFFQDILTSLPPGEHCFGNLPPDHSNTRAQFGKKIFSSLLETFAQQQFPDMSSRDKYLVEQLFSMLSDKTEIPVEEGLGGSFRHVFNEVYPLQVQNGNIEAGSVSSTVLIVDKMNNCHFSERTNFKSIGCDDEFVNFDWVVD